MRIMYALTVRQPHAELIVCGKKTIDVRTWWPRVQLPMLVAIHAGKEPDKAACSLAWMLADSDLGPEGRHLSDRLGGIVGVARLVERIELDYMTWHRRQSEHLNPGNAYRPDRKGLVFADAVRFDAIIPCRGRLGLWELPEEMEREVRRRMGEGVR